MFTSLGGHSFAAGFELPAENIPILIERVNAYAKEITGGGIKAQRSIDIDTLIMPSDVNIETYNYVSKLAPFGNGNPEPLFMARNVKIVEIDTVGNGGKHLKMK